jgi:hypothetical protein
MEISRWRKPPIIAEVYSVLKRTAETSLQFCRPSGARCLDWRDPVAYATG